MDARLTLLVVAVITVLIAVGVILLVVPGPFNEGLSVLMPVKR
jgi:hypothetical protein